MTLKSVLYVCIIDGVITIFVCLLKSSKTSYLCRTTFTRSIVYCIIMSRNGSSFTLSLPSIGVRKQQLLVIRSPSSANYFPFPRRNEDTISFYYTIVVDIFMVTYSGFSMFILVNLPPPRLT